MYHVFRLKNEYKVQLFYTSVYNKKYIYIYIYIPSSSHYT